MGQPPIEHEPTTAIVEQAAAWLAHLESGDADEADLVAFRQWRGANRAHALAIDRLGGLGARLSQSATVEQDTLRRLFLKRPRRRGLAVVALFLAMGGAGYLVSQTTPARIYLADERTAIGETRKVALADGSRIVMGTGSVADLDERGGRRDVELLRGEVYAEVAKGGARPFTVHTADGSAEALGTAFTVRKTADDTRITVVESHVRVCPADAPRAACITLAPGEVARMTATRGERLAAIDPAEGAAWTEGWLPVSDRPLVEVLDELNRWRTVPVRYDRPALAGLRVSGMLPLNDTDRALVNLERLLPITVVRRGGGAEVVRRAE